jgi:hypothetical protein
MWGSPQCILHLDFSKAAGNSASLHAFNFSKREGRLRSKNWLWETALTFSDKRERSLEQNEMMRDWKFQAHAASLTAPTAPPLPPTAHGQAARLVCSIRVPRVPSSHSVLAPLEPSPFQLLKTGGSLKAHRCPHAVAVDHDHISQPHGTHLSSYISQLHACPHRHTSLGQEQG